VKSLNEIIITWEKFIGVEGNNLLSLRVYEFAEINGKMEK
jgi:hypothetical protein